MPDLESVWEHREDIVYKSTFGDMGQGIFTLPLESFAPDAQPGLWWGHAGVCESAPNDKHATWIYVTSGLSNPWDDDPAEYGNNTYSGLGAEFVIETGERAKWAVTMLHKMMAYELNLAMSGKPLLAVGGRIGGGGPFFPDSTINTFLITSPEHYTSSFQVDSGRVDFLHFLGITPAELDFAKANTSQALLDRLKSQGAATVTDLKRPPVV